MTILTASVWGGRVSVVVDRQVTRASLSGTRIVNSEASKLLAVLSRNALYSISYTGVAVAGTQWMDEAIASCLAFRKIKTAMIQPGASFFLSQHLHLTMKNLAFNLPVRLRNSPFIASAGLTLAVAGWHLRPRLQPFIWELAWTPVAGEVGGTMAIKRHQVAKHFRQFKSGLCLHAWGDTGKRFEQKMEALGATQGFTHDDVERYIVSAIVARSKETQTVGNQCLALQLDPRDRDGHVQFTYYPSGSADDSNRFLSGWVVAPTSIHSPTRESTSGSSYSPCGRYVLGGFSDPNVNLTVRTRLPMESVHHGGPVVMSYKVQPRTVPPTT